MPQFILNHLPKWGVLMEVFFLSAVPLLILLTIRQIKIFDGAYSQRKQKLEEIQREDQRGLDSGDTRTASDEEILSYTDDYQLNLDKFRKAALDMDDVNERTIFLQNLKARGILFLWTALPTNRDSTRIY